MGATEVVPLAVAARNCHDHRTGSHRRSAAVGGVFKDKETAGRHAMPGCGSFVDLRMRLAFGDVCGGEDEVEPLKQAHPSQDVVREVGAAAGGHTLGQAVPLQMVDQGRCTWHQAEPIVEE